MKNGRMANKRILKWVASGVMLALLFAMVFAGTLSGAFGVENALQNSGVIENNVADADNVADTNIVIGLDDPQITEWNINPDVNKKGYVCDDGNYLVTDTSDLTWTTGNGTTGGTWMLGDSDDHHYQRYATAWFDYDLGADYTKYSDKISISITGTLSATTNPAYIALVSSSNEFSSYSDTGADSLYDTVVGLSNKSSGVGNGASASASVSLTEPVTGRYVRIYFTCKGRYQWIGSREYGIATFKDIKVTLTRTLKSYSVAYDKNTSYGTTDTATIGNTNHKYMANSNITSNIYVGRDYYFTGWNTNANGSGVAMGIGASTGTSIATGMFGSVVKTNLGNSQTTTTLFAQWGKIPIKFNGTLYDIYDSSKSLTVLQGQAGYFDTSIYSSISGYTFTIAYKSGNTTISEPTTEGSYFAVITVKNSGGTTVGVSTVPYEIISGDFGSLTSGTSGKWGSSTNPYVISSATHLKNLSGIVNGTQTALNSVGGGDVQAGDETFADCYFIIVNDIDMNGIDFDPIGKENRIFRGHITGVVSSTNTAKKKRTITNLRIERPSMNYVGLFGYSKLVNSVRPSIEYIALGDGCYIKGANYVGGIVGWGQDIDVLYCENNVIVEGDTYVVEGNQYVGGIIGKNFGAATKYCINKANVSGDKYVGGIAGQADWGSIWGTSGVDTNTGKIHGASYVGGIVGWQKSQSVVQDCVNNGKVVADSDYSGGICGAYTVEGDYNQAFSNLKNKGEVSGVNYVGGVYGSATGVDGSANVMNGLSNTGGKVTATGNYVGGVFGFIQTLAVGTLSNSSSVSGNDYVAGSIGFVKNAKINGASNSGSISGINYVGGIVGKSETCVMSGKISNTGAVAASKDVKNANDRTYIIVASKTNKTGNTESIDNIRDDNDKTKYCSTSSKNASFVVDLASAVILRGFSIANANDNETSIQRTAKIVKIWGTNTEQSGSAENAAGAQAPSGWDLVYSNTNLQKADTNNAKTTYSFSNFRAYRFYWVYVESKAINSEGKVSNQLQFSEFDFIADNGDAAQFTGGIAGWAEGINVGTDTEFESNAQISSTGYYVGGIFGYVTNSTVNAKFTVNNASGDSVTGIAGVGGAFGYVDSNVAISGKIDVKCSEVDKEDGNENYIYGGVVGYNAGTIDAKIEVTARVISRGYGTLNGLTGSFVGGVVGYNAGTLKGSVEKSSGDVLSVAENDYAGGIVGYNAGTMSGTFTHSSSYVAHKQATVLGGNYVGGIVGYTTTITIDGASNAGSVVASGSQAVGGIVGGIASGASATITNCSNTGAVTATNANGVAGIIGHSISAENNINVSSCSNTGNIQGKVNTGGIGGRMETTLGLAGSLSFTQCYNSGDIKTSTGDTVGGIVGYLFANSDDTTRGIASLTYSFSSGKVESGNDGVRQGAIAGNPRGKGDNQSTKTVVEYCYTTQDMSISGDVNAYVSNTNFIIYSTVPSCLENGSVINGGKYIQYDKGMEVLPSYYSAVGFEDFKDKDENGKTSSAWLNILSYQINAFRVIEAKVTPTTGQGFSSVNIENSNYVKPNKADNDNTNAAVRDNMDAQNISGWYIVGTGTNQVSNNLRLSIVNITIEDKGTTYNGEQQGFARSDVKWSGTNLELSSIYKIQFIYYCKYNENEEVCTSDEGAKTKPINVGTYTVTVLVYIGDTVVGKYTYATYTIDKASLSISHTTVGVGSSPYTYNSKQQGVKTITVTGFVSQDGINKDVELNFITTNVAYNLSDNVYTMIANQSINCGQYRVAISMKESRNYKLDKDYNFSWTINPFNLSTAGNAVLGGNGYLTLGNTGVKDFGNNSYYELNNALVYTADAKYIKSNFLVCVKYNDGNSARLVLGNNNDYTLATSTSVTSGYGTTSEGLHYATADPINVTLTATGRGNFTGAISVTYTAMISDFGGNYGSANWGSESNVFEISHPAHLIRLSEIVNGGKAWNSIRTTNTNICLTNNTSVASNITTRLYQNAYFEVMKAIDLTEYFNEGNGKSFTPIGNSLDHAFSGAFDGVSEARNIHLYINLTSDYVGLFGFVKGGTRTTTDNGYYMTPNGAIIKNVTVTGSVKGGSYVGGIVGVAGYVSIENCVNRASVEGISCVGGIVGMTGNVDKQVGWGRTATKLTNTGKITATGENVGGIVGYARDTTFYGNISNSGEIVGRQGAGGLLGFLCGGSIGNAYQSQNAIISNSGKVTGGNYVGGITGRVMWASVYGTVSNSGQISGVAGVGGIVGAFNSSIESNGTMSQDLTSRFNTTSVTNNGAVDGSNYVGGIFGACYTGYTASNAEYAFSTGTVKNTKNVTGTGTYIGGIAGWLESSANTSDFVISTDNSNANIYIDASTNITVTGKNCVGYLFGVLVGNGYHGTSGASIATKLNIGSVFKGAVNGIDGGAVLGGLVGFMSKSGMMFSTNWNTNTISFGNMTNMSFVGGLVGMLGENGTIESAVTYDPNNGSFVTGGVHTITANTTFGSASDRLGNFVGGVVGYVTSSAGTFYGNNANILGNSIQLVNTGSIYGGSYVGGIFGAVGDFVQSDIYSNTTAKTIKASYVLSLDASVQGFIAELLWSGNFAGERSGNTLTLNPTANDTWHQVGENATLSAVKGKIINKADGYILGDSYVGGLIGYVGSNMMITFENAELSSTIENLSIYSTSGNYNGIVGTGDYIGGLIGYLSGEGHSLKNIVVRAFMGSVYNATEKTISAGPDNTVSKYIGGIVGFMNSGTIENCVAMHTGDSINSGTSIWKGADLVGGLVGYTSTGIIKNSYTSGFKFANTTNTRGGLVGMGVSATIEDSWSFYVASSGVDYSTISKNSYGKYIAVDDDFDVTLTLENIVAFVNNKQLSFEVTVPTNNKQLAFYDASGSDTVTNNIAENKEDSKFKNFSYANGKITIELDAESGYSMLVYTTPVKFVNVAQGNTGETEKVRVAYRHPSSSEHYDAEVTDAIFTDGVVTHVIANIYFNPYGNECVLVGGSASYNENGKLVGAYNQTFVKGSEASPYTIGSWKEWQQFADSVKGGTSYSGLYISLTQSISGNATGYLAGDATHSFMGTFNGNGYTINIGNITSASDGTSLFPYANGATFKNLTIAGSITSSHTGTAGFVGIANGSLTFENCTNQVSITSSGKNVGGILGQSHNNTSTYEFTDCVNEAKLVTYNKDDTVTGIGGIAGNIVTAGGNAPKLDGDGNDIYLSDKSTEGNNSVATVLLESCRNAGIIYGIYNVAGIIGRTGGNTSVRNCGNTGDVSAYGSNCTYSNGSFSNAKQVNGQNTCSGGIGGLVTTYAHINVYASYNTGNILGWGNKAGGILATDCEYKKSESTTHIYYCYNTGDVTVGGTRLSSSANEYSAWSDNNESFGVQGGGILGNMVNGDVQYCYNTGTITGNGIVGELAKWRVRIGGIVGFVDSNEAAKEKKCTLVKNCYNIGIIVSGSWGGGIAGIGAGPAKGAGPIIGATKDDDNITSDVTKTYEAMNYSIANACYVVYTGKYTNSYDNPNAAWSTGNVVGDSNASTPNGYELMTAYMNSSGTLEMPGNDNTLASGFRHSQSVYPLDKNDIENVNNGGYVYVYGCLPQLAVFAVDTQNGLAMTSVAYGQNQYGEYEKQQAGGEFNPFVVKDGIDLLGLQSLVEQGYTFADKYIEFANSNNNLEKTQAKEIVFPTHSSTTSKYSGDGYKSRNGTTYTKGKSYHLFEKGAVCTDAGYVAWLGRNTYQAVTTGSTVPTNNATYDKINLPTIGRTIARSFHGNISGKQSDYTATKLMDVRISAGYAGLFSVTKNAKVSYIEVSGNSSISSVNVAGGIVARPRGTSVVDHCAISGNTTVKSYGKNTGFAYSAGGIVGYAYTRAEDGEAFAQGTILTISNCIVNTTGDIVGYKQYIGGILGTTLDFNDAEGKNNSVLIENCRVLAGNIYADQSDSQYVGGIIGYSSFNGDRTRDKEKTESDEHYAAEKKKAETLLSIIVGITGCEVGTGSGSVSIKGKTDIGGIVGAASKVQGGYIKDCTVGANATITATADCSNIGGIVGSSDEGQSADSVTMTFQGTNTFGGTINLNNKKASNIGGVIGTMNRGASFFAGSVINVNEKTSGNIINPGSGSANIGGVAGLTTDAMFSGTFSVAPKMNTGIVDNVGGFIGKNTGESNILAEGTTITISGNISGATEVGGFIGINDNGASLVVGDDMVKGKPYTGDLKITVNATINAGGNNVGGIVGKNEGSVSIVKGTISTSAKSSVGGANNVGGIIGFNDGNLATGGSTVANAELSITNNGSVSGTNYVGGVFGLLNKGIIAGSFTNGGSVNANSYFAGGVIGYLANGASIGSNSNTTAITLTNSGSVSASSYAGGSIGYVEKGATIIANSNTSAKVTLTNSGSVGVTNYFAGGSIGILYGSIEGTASNRVLFSVAGTNASIAGKSYLGGSIGVIVGKIDYAQFTNSANLTINDGETAIGGSVGFVGKPAIDYVSAISNINNIDSGYKNLALGDIVISNSHFESTGSLTVNTTSAQAESSADDHTTSGGVGGAIGVVGGDVNLFNVQGWNNNTYYAMANVIAPSANNVGGVFGLVRADRFEISNMLAYQTTVQGNYNVGGIVGAITGANVKISSSFALEGKFSGTSNVGGIVGLANDTTDASTAYWMLGLGNATLAGSNVNELSTRLGFNGSGDSLTYAIKSEGDAKIYTTGHSNTGWFFLYANNADGTDGMGTINVTHKVGETSGVSNSLAYWKYIAQAYSVGETVPATMTGSALTSNGTISANHVYATATAAPVANGGTGFYLYTQTSQEGTNPNITHYTTTDDKDAFYININTSQNVGNFVVYYRMITSVGNLTYNGYARTASVGMEDVGVITSTNDQHANGYYYTTKTQVAKIGEDGNIVTDADGNTVYDDITTAMTDPGEYKSEFLIYYYDSDGTPYNVGGHGALSWSIRERTLGTKVKIEGNRIYGEKYGTNDEHDMVITLDNVAPADGLTKDITFDVVYDSETVKFVWKNGETFGNASGTVSNASTMNGITISGTATLGNDMSGNDLLYVVGGVDDKDVKTRIYTFYIDFTTKNTYKVTVDNPSGHYSIGIKDKEFAVVQRTITITPEWTAKTNNKYTYNVSSQGVNAIKVDAENATNKTGLISGDVINVKIDIQKKKDKNSSYEDYGVKSVIVTIDEANKAYEVALNTLDAGEYKITYSIILSASSNKNAENYAVADGSKTSTWEIEKYTINLSGFSGIDTQGKVYDGKAVTPKLSISDSNLQGSGTSFTFNGDTIDIKYSIKVSGSEQKAIVNVGTYKLLVDSDNGTITATHNGGKQGDASDNYTFGSTKAEISEYKITARKIELKWSSAPSNGWVYDAKQHYLTISSATSDGMTHSLSGTASETTAKLKGCGNDVITVTYSGSKKDVGSNYSMSYTKHTVSGINSDVQSIDGNYEVVSSTKTSGTFKIVPSDLKINVASVSGVNKVYDGNTNVTNGKISWSITHGNNNGHIPTNSEDENSYSYFKLTSKAFVSKDVGTNIGISVTISFVSSNNNYTGNNYSATIYGGTITPKPIMVVLSGLRNGKATKVYDGDATYAGSISGNGTAGSRLGERFTVSGLLDNNVTISAEYKEAGNDRSFFDSYVNGVFKNADNTYSQEANKYYKKLVFTMSGDGANNYQFNVYNTSNQAYGKADGVGKDSTVTVYDSADDANRDNCGVAGGITIEITINSVRVNYSNTYQSYVDENGSYKEKWDRVTGTISGDSNVVKVHNYWMYEDGIDDEKDEGYKKYTGYTVIKGSKNSKLLYAEVNPKNGMQYNYRLSNQPTLTIAYFVSETGAFEIDSMSDLLIASFYYSASQNATAPEFVQIVKSGYKWIGLVSNEEYEADMATWDAEFEKHEGVFLNESSTEDGMKENWWGYYEATEDSTDKTIPSSFILTKDIYGMLTKDDIEKIDAFFTVAKSDDNGNIKQTPYEWGNGKTYLGNLLTAKEGSVVTLLGSLFVTDSGNTGFSGSFDGNGYVIEYLNIMGYEYNNVGLFDVIGDGTVEDLHLRNININANKGNVGGIAGQINTGAKAVSNVSFHGSINVSGSGAVNVGELFGQSARDISNSIVLGTINSSNTSAVVGGVVGSSSASISKVVSMMQINANGTTGAFVGSGTNATDSFHMANAVYNGTSFVNAADSAKTYSELMNGSTSGYTTDNKYYKESGDNTEAGTYDVLADVYYVEGTKDENARQSMRLYDIVSVYLLMYSLNTGKASLTNVGEVNVYTISSESWLVGSKHGTDAANDAIIIANKQNVSLLRELRFATFTLASNIDVTISSTFSGAFYGTVNAGGYKITCNKDMFGVYLNDKSTWLAVSANS